VIYLLKNFTATANLVAEDMKRVKEFYSQKLGLEIQGEFFDGGMLLLKAGNGTNIVIYKKGKATAENTAVSFAVENVEKEVQELKAKGIVFEEYNNENLKTVNSIATHGTAKAAWFKDTEGNILAITSM
jgi:predicted enzyme related to lactoylglutathione lyase